MLRVWIAIIAGAILIMSCVASLFGTLFTPGIVTPLVVLIALAFERWRYKTSDKPAPAGFEATGERFVDPGTGKTVEVYFNRQTGERRYVDENQVVER